MSDTPHKPRRRIVINVDADPHNANWLRILGERRQQQMEQEQQQQPPSGQQQSDQKAP